MKANSTPPNLPRFANKPDDFWALNHITARSRVLNDAGARDSRDNQDASVTAYQSRRGTSGAYVVLGISGAGIDLRSANTPENTRALAAALIEAADICESFDAEASIREEQETARINAGPIPDGDGIARIELPGGVVAFEAAGEVAA